MSSKVIKYLKTHHYELFVFGSLLMLIILSTYVLYGGTTIGDQWYHQGRALLFMSGSIREAVLSYEETSYPPFQSALLAALTTLSGIPLVNSYAGIAFLDAVLIFAFYYFFLTWAPRSLRKAALLACSLFTLASGFGWIHVMAIATTHPIVSQQSSLEALTTIGNLDILNTSNFVIPSAPEFSTALIYIAMPAGFVLLGMVRACINTKLNLFIITIISVLGIISHYEFYLFIIIACILPPIFKMKEKNFLYFSFLIAISIVYVIDITTPGNFYTSESILGIPLLFLVGLFVILTWIIYLTAGYLRKPFNIRSMFLNLRKSLYHNTRFKFVISTLIIILVAYIYLLSFIVLGQLSLSTIRDHMSERTVPWYIYPMKWGVSGLLAVAFILSYLFKKFEKPVFIFGIIVVIALFAGPYYSESRFSKYVMVGIIGFASLMIYKILNRRLGTNPIRNTVLIGIIVPLSGLSILIFIGYNSLILQTQDYIETLPRRHFPSVSEIGLFEALHNMVRVDSNKHNVVSFPNQYHLWKDGIMSKIPSFTGLPYDKVRQSPLTLNVSTIDALYRLLDHTDARYIIIPKNSVQLENSVTQPTRFAIDYFKHRYEDNNFIILEVPYIKPPIGSTKSDFAVVYNEGEELPLLGDSYVRLLPYNNNTFDFKIKDGSVAVQKDNQADDIILLGSKKGNETTLWTKTISQQRKVNSIESTFRTASDDGNKNKDSIGLKWREGNIEYYTKIYESGLSLYQKPIEGQYKILSRNSELKKQDWMWYTLRIESTDNSIKVYVNNVLKIQAPKVLNGNDSEGISRIGLVSSHNKVEFKPLKTSGDPQLSKKEYDDIKYYNYYYPTSILALSMSNYDIFRDSDLTVFSKNAIVVSDALKIDNYSFSKYLEYLSTGGKLVVINSDNNFNGTFSRLFSIHSDDRNAESFKNIGVNNSETVSINVPGSVKKLETNPNVRVVAWYRNSNNQTVVPFAIEKSYANGGKIILINAEGYFKSISNSPKQYFDSLSNVLKLLNLNSSKVMVSKNTAIPMQGFTGNMEILGKVTLNSSSLSLPDEDSYSYNLRAKSIKIYNKTNSLPITLDNLLIKSLKLIGESKAMVNLTGMMELPGMRSDHDYISMMIPSNFNMTVHLSPEKLSYMEIMNGNRSNINTIKFYNDSKIEFYNVRAAPPLKSVHILLKSPEMLVNGHTNFTNANFDGYLLERGGLDKGSPLSLQGTLKSKFDFVDHYNEPFYGGTKTQYITYFRSLVMDGRTEGHKDLLQLPGDISSRAKEGIPLTKILGSSINITILVVLSIVTTVGVWLIQRLYSTHVT